MNKHRKLSFFSDSPLAKTITGNLQALVHLAKAAKVEDADIGSVGIISSAGDIKAEITVFKDGRVHVTWEL